MRLRLLTTAATACLLAAAPAHAAVPWSAPATLQDGLTDATPSAAVTTARGHVVAGWSTESAAAGEGGTLALNGRTIDAGRPIDAGPVAYASDHAAVITARAGRIVGGYVTSTLYLRTLDAATGALSHSTALVRDTTVEHAALAGGPSGQVAAAWIEQHGSKDHVVYAVRGSDGRLGTPHVISGHGHAEDVAIAYDDHGNLYVAYARSPKMVLRVQAHGHSIGTERVVGPASGLVDASISGGAGSRWVLAWSVGDAAGAGPGFPPRVYATQGLQSSFQTVRTLAAGGANEGEQGTVVTARGDDDVATVAFTLPEATGQTVHVATACANESFVTSDTRIVGDVSGIATAPGGTTTVLAGAASSALAIARPAGARAFVAPETIDSGEPDADVLAAATPDGHLHAFWVAGSDRTHVVKSADRGD